MRKLILFIFLPLGAIAQNPRLQNVTTSVNKFDKSIEISYMPAEHMMGYVPFFISTEMLGEDTSHTACFMQEISRDTYIKNKDGRAVDFEILTSSGIKRITVEQLKKTYVKYDTGMFSSGFAAVATMPINKNLLNLLFTANGFRINNFGEGSVFGDNKKAKLEFQLILTKFSNANPNLK